MTKVLKAYCDKETRKIHLVGDDVKLTKERHIELAQGGFVEEYKEPKQTTKKEK